MRRFLFLLIIISFQFTLRAQQRTIYPYSFYGIGEINPKGFARNLSMGRTGIALSSNRYLNNVNPASYSSIDSVSFFYDFGIGGEYVKYWTNFIKPQHGTDANIRDLAIGFRITKHWASSIGINPYSTVGYKIQTVKEIEGAPNEYFTATITGNGGLNQFYWNNSVLFFKKLSLGVSFNYLFGNIELSENDNAPSLNTQVVVGQTSYLKKLYADFGLQYSTNISKNFKFTFGAIFGNNHQLNFKERFTISETLGVVYDDKITKRSTFNFPWYAGGGVALVYKEKLTATADYIYTDWSGTSSANHNFSYRSNNVFRAGLELIPGRKAQIDMGYFGNLAYRAGFYYEQSYLELNRKTFADKGFTLGIGIPFLQSRTTINLAYNYGINGTLNNNLIRERYQSLMISLTLHDWWFIQRKIE